MASSKQSKEEENKKNSNKKTKTKTKTTKTTNTTTSKPTKPKTNNTNGTVKNGAPEPEVIIVPSSSCDSQESQEQEQEQEEETKRSQITKTAKKSNKSKRKENEEEEEGEEAKMCVFPMMRIKKIIKSEGSDSLITQDAVFLVNKASEMFVEQFCEDAYECSVHDRKKSLHYNHLSSVVSKQRRYDFLSDFVPEKLKAEDALAEWKSAETGG